MVAAAGMHPGQRSWRMLLVIAGLHDCGLAAYHFILPRHMQWERGLVGVPDSLTWALFALNFSWSLLLFLAGALVLYAARIGSSAPRFARVTIFTIGLFWAIHGTYTVLNPFPLPPAMSWVRIVIALFPLIVVALHWMPLALTRQRRTF